MKSWRKRSRQWCQILTKRIISATLATNVQDLSTKKLRLSLVLIYYNLISKNWNLGPVSRNLQHETYTLSVLALSK